MRSVLECGLVDLWSCVVCCILFTLVEVDLVCLVVGPLCRLDQVDLCVKADRVPSSGPVRTIAEAH